MQGMMCGDEVDPLDPGLFHIPMLESQSYRIEPQRNTQSVAVVEAGKQLLIAAKDGDVDFVRHLISKGAPFTTDWLGVSPLHLAAQNNHIATADVLLRAGISRDARTKVERTPLHFAAQEGHTEMVQLLISQGADVNCRDMLRMTPLHWSVEKEHASVVETLLKAGADPEAESKFGKTPMSIAQDLGRSDIVHLLETTESNPVMTLQQTEQLHQTTLEATEQITADLNMSDDMTRQLVAGNKRQRVRVQVQSKPAAPSARPAPTAASAASTVPTPPAAPAAAAATAVPVTSVTSAGSAAEVDSIPPQINAATVNISDTDNTMQLLQAHGITMLPTDKTTIVESAVERGQTVVLTEAGKMALNLSGIGGRLIGTKRATAPVRTVANAKAPTSSSAAALSGIITGGVQRRSPTVLGNQSRIIKIHPSQLVALGGGRVQVPSFKVDQLLMQQGKVPNIVKRVVPGKLQRIILTSAQQQQLRRQQLQQQHQQQLQLQQHIKEAPEEEEEFDTKMEDDVIIQKVEDPLSHTSTGIPKTSDSSHSTDIARITQELAEARKQAAEFREQLAKKEREAELYCQQLRSLKSAAK